MILNFFLKNKNSNETIKIFKQNLGIEFEIEKYAMLIIKKMKQLKE